MDLEYSWFKRKILEITGLDLESYRPEQMKRLLGRMLDKAGVKNYVEYIKYLNNNPDRIQEFRDSVTINVSSLFRDCERWDELSRILPDIVARKIADGRSETQDVGGPVLQVWSAGCSIGAEAYTIAILLEELKLRRPEMKFSYRILCTDIDHNMLQRGRDGIVSNRETREVPKRHLDRYFKEIEQPGLDWTKAHTTDCFFRIKPEIVRNMRFRIHNLLDEKWEMGFDLIVCRNVLIYFKDDVKEMLFRHFHEALSVEGILFIGGTEIIFSPERFGLENAGTDIYRKMKAGKGD